MILNRGLEGCLLESFIMYVFVERKGAVLPFQGKKWVEAEENQEVVECCLCCKKIHGVSSCNILLQRGFLVID